MKVIQLTLAELISELADGYLESTLQLADIYTEPRSALPCGLERCDLLLEASAADPFSFLYL